MTPFSSSNRWDTNTPPRRPSIPGVSSDYRTRTLRAAMNKMTAEATGADERKAP